MRTPLAHTSGPDLDMNILKNPSSTQTVQPQITLQKTGTHPSFERRRQETRRPYEQSLLWNIFIVIPYNLYSSYNGISGFIVHLDNTR